MRIHLTYFLALLPITAFGRSFEEAAEHLDLGGTFVAYMDFDGDGQEVGEKFNKLYQEILAVSPNMMPIPLDFPSLFDAMGFGSIEAIGASSIEVEAGLHLNKSVALLDGDLSGLFRLYSGEQSEFTAAALAPADATTAATAHINYEALIETATDVASRVMGPMGESIVGSWLAGSAFGTEVSYAEVFSALSGKWNIAIKQGLADNMETEIEAWFSIEGAGSLLTKIRAIESSFGVPFVDGPEGLTADLSAFLQGGGMNIFLFAPNDSDDLIVYTNPAWTAQSEGPRLAQDADFQQLAARLPSEAMLFSYNTGIDITPIYTFIESNPQTADYSGIARRVIDELLADFLKPTVSAAYLQDEAFITEQYAGYSTKQVVAVLPVAVVGALAATTIPAMQNVQATSEEKAVTNNLRQIASAAQQYMLETGADRASMSDIVGPDKYISGLSPVAGESYDDIVVTYETYSISVVLADGRVVSYEF